MKVLSFVAVLHVILYLVLPKDIGLLPSIVPVELSILIPSGKSIYIIYSIIEYTWFN